MIMIMPWKCLSYFIFRFIQTKINSKKFLKIVLKTNLNRIPKSFAITHIKFKMHEMDNSVLGFLHNKLLYYKS